MAVQVAFDRVAFAAARPRDARGVFVASMTSEERKASRAKRARERRAANPDKIRARDRARAPQRKLWQRAHRAANPEQYRLRERTRALKRYGLTIAQWDAMFEQQGCKCMCCGATEPGGRNGSRWATDHDHTTEAVRGILCNRCNTTLGLLGDNADGVLSWCERFLTYLENSLCK